VSGITGICNFDGRPVSGSLLHRMTAAIAHRGPDHIRHWVNGAVGFGHSMLHTTAESVNEKQPVTDECGKLCLTMDGRVDNRAEMITALEAKGVRLRDNTDAEIVLRAYQCWGSDCPQKIIGDFAFAIWDERQRHLFCARDLVGNKPFVYHWNGRRFLFSSELHALFEDPATPHEPNEGMIGEYLAVKITHTEETLYKNIMRLPPAHSMIVKNGQAKKRRYWNPGDAREIKYRTDREYAEHFSEVFKESVRSCLRSHRPVGAFLSGGLDSSSVVSMAQTIYREGLVDDLGFETFSMVYPGLACDETVYIREMVERWNLRANYIPLKESPLDRLREQTSFYKDICDYPNGTHIDPIRLLAKEKGMRVLLTGFGGDERLSGSLYYFSDFVRRGNFLRLFEEMRKQNITPASARGLSALFHYALVPLLPDVTRRMTRSLRRVIGQCPETFSWIRREFARRINLADRLRADITEGRPLRSSKMWLRLLLEHGGRVHGTEIEDRAAARLHLEQRHPFTDRRMIELSFNLPENQRLRGDQKLILRHAMEGMLPELIRQRRDKAEFSETLFRALSQTRAELACAPGPGESGWIDRPRVQIMRKEMERLHSDGNEDYILRVWPLWMVWALDLWAEGLPKENAPSKNHTCEVAVGA
jgi:asparagine synthase (glutamine-hydrolysing)